MCVCGVPAYGACLHAYVCISLMHGSRPLPLSRSLVRTVKRAPAPAGVLAADDVHTGSLLPVRGTKASGVGKDSRATFCKSSEPFLLLGVGTLGCGASTHLCSFTHASNRLFFRSHYFSAYSTALVVLRHDGKCFRGNAGMPVRTTRPER